MVKDQKNMADVSRIAEAAETTPLTGRTPGEERGGEIKHSLAGIGRPRESTARAVPG